MIRLLADNESYPTWWKVAIAVSVMFFPFVLTYLVTTWEAATAVQGKAVQIGRPPTLPYTIPWLGHVFDFLSDGGRLLATGVSYFGSHTPFKIILGPTRVYVISGAELVAPMFKATKEISGNRNTMIAMEYAFGSPRKSVEFYEADDSGMLPSPTPGCMTKPEDRIFWITHKVITTFLSGVNLTPITTRFQQSLSKKVAEPGPVGYEWVDIPDLYAFLQVQILEAAVRAIMGEHILSLNPTFVKDFWDYDRGMRGLFLQTPRWLSPGIYRARDKMLENVKRWHRYAFEHCDLSKIPDDVEWEPYWGARFERYRQANLLKWKALDDTARAAEDLGTLWAMNANSIPASAWMILEILSNMTLESRVQTELAACLDIPSTITPPPNSPPSPQIRKYDVTKLCASPLLQSIYAETLRIRVAIMGTREIMAPSFSLNEWRFHRGELLTYTSSISAMDTTTWSAGSDAHPHPLNAFWADRFLVYPGIAESGPLLRRDAKGRKSRSTQHTTPNNDTDAQRPTSSEQAAAETKTASASSSSPPSPQPHFTLEGLAASWIPYGGGIRLCPGRHFAKQEMIVSTAVWLTAYEIELQLRPGQKIGVDKSYYGFGTMPPGGKIAARMRRRRDGGGAGVNGVRG